MIRPCLFRAFTLAVLFACGLAPVRAAETCTTQSQMKPADRAILAEAATRLAQTVQAGDSASLRSSAVPELQADFAAVSSLVASTAPLLRGATPRPEQLYLLDASTLAPGTSGSNPDAQFFCPLAGTPDEADFSIPQLPPGLYAFAMVDFAAAAPMRLSLLLRQQAGGWKLAGLYPRPLSAAGHDGLWYWKQARTLETEKQPWNAWLYLGEAQQLLTPAGFVSSTHLEKLAAEHSAAAPPALSAGISAQKPLVVKAAGGVDFRIVSLSTETYTPGTLDVIAHFAAESLGDASAARQRNDAAATALLAAHPELRSAFHGVWVFADVPNSNPYGTELSMTDIH